ncbi:MAG: 2-hydroxymuconate tautomerase family protein [Schwartzia sp.]|nr:2-hydroxymuconate tautomerase family protein [Schwartzia sp. (in: firmicutes)]
MRQTIKITKEGNVTADQKRQLIEGATNLLRDVLGKNTKSLVVTIDELDTDNWGIGGVPVTEIRKRQK